MLQQRIIQSENIARDLTSLLESERYDKIFILTDPNSDKFCFPLIAPIPEIMKADRLIIKAGDVNKNLETLSDVWQFLSEKEASRKSILINLGGGMLTDLGGFAAATFKRGISFVNIPTTLLGAVDAAVGGKTGMNFNGLKNEIGVFAPAIAVIIHADFFKTLNHSEFLSGYAEMMKHALLDSKDHLKQILSFDLEDIDYQKLNVLLFNSVAIKEKIVSIDPKEEGIRKALNLGHTFGHAFESLSHISNQAIAHGYAVAWGIICELYLSFLKLDFNKDLLITVTSFIKDNYGKYNFDCQDYKTLYELMLHDKKNESSRINFSLLSAPGEIKIDQTATQQEIEEALDFLRDY